MLSQRAQGLIPSSCTGSTGLSLAPVPEDMTSSLGFLATACTQHIITCSVIIHTYSLSTWAVESRGWQTENQPSLTVCWDSTQPNIYKTKLGDLPPINVILVFSLGKSLMGESTWSQEYYAVITSLYSILILSSFLGVSII